MAADAAGSGRGEVGDSSASGRPVPSALPSDAELRVLRQLWDVPEQSVRQIHEEFSPEWDVGYTTVLKLLQRMHEKGLVERRKEGRAHLYRATVSEERTERRVVRDFVDRTLQGSVRKLLQRALPEEPVDEEELREVLRLLDAWEEG